MAAARDANDLLDRQATATAQYVRQRHAGSTQSLERIVTLDASGQISEVFEAPPPMAGVFDEMV